jgi:hypothetical protein
MNLYTALSHNLRARITGMCIWTTGLTTNHEPLRLRAWTTGVGPRVNHESRTTNHEPRKANHGPRTTDHGHKHEPWAWITGTTNHNMSTNHGYGYEHEPWIAGMGVDHKLHFRAWTAVSAGPIPGATGTLKNHRNGHCHRHENKPWVCALPHSFIINCYSASVASRAMPSILPALPLTSHDSKSFCLFDVLYRVLYHLWLSLEIFV